MVSLEDLRRSVAGRIRVGESLAPFTGLGIGGPAAFLVEPATEEAFVAAVCYFRAQGVPRMLIRRGSNLLVAPRGYDGAAISVEGGVEQVEPLEGASCRAGAGTRLAALVDYCIARGLAGAEQLAGVDGTVGGTLVRGDGPLAGASGEIDVIREGAVVRLPPGAPLRGDDVVLAARLNFTPAHRDELILRRRAHLASRLAAGPLNIPHSAVMFRDPPGGRASELIAASGVRAPRHGTLAFSPASANVMVRTGEASPADVLDMLTAVRRSVRRSCGVTLEPALKTVGFGAGVLREVA
ncbi:MAG TPA: FAD-binding protein [Bacteroidota bacterium]|nr:FAD-binding protein [Bacteroidota bacterium]